MIVSFDFLFLIRLSAIWSLLLLFYFLALGKNDNWPLKRYFLLAAYVLGLVLPLLPTVFENTTIESYTLGNQIASSPFLVNPLIDVVETNTATFWNWQTILMSTYLAICLGLVIRMMRSFLLLRHWRIHGKESSFEGYSVIQHAQVRTPMAGFNTIFLPLNSDGDAMNRVSTEMAILHEKTHLQQGHQWERLPLLLGHIFFWFHPLQWLFQHFQEQVQEYEVDEGVLQCFSLKQYGKLLIQGSIASTMSWHPNLFSSPLKNRIDMMCKPKNKQSWRFYHTIALSLLLGFIIVSCTDVVDNQSLEQTSIFPEAEVDQPAYVIHEEFGSDQAMEAFYNTVGRAIKYPKEARVNSITGQFTATFTIGQNGDLKNMRFDLPYKGDPENELVVTGYRTEEKANNKLSASQTKELKALIEKEISTVISDIEWKPAMKNGKAVSSTKQSLFKFRLD